MKRRFVLSVAGGALTLTTLLVTPLLLKRMDFFRVRQIELLGVRYLSPDAVLDALELQPTHNLFEDMSDSEDRLHRIGGVTAARIERRLPGTLRVVVTERTPMAFAPGPEGLVALDARARPLPYDPAENGLDLPVVAHPDSQLVETLGVVRFADPELYHQVDWVDFDRRGGISLAIGEQRILLEDVPSVDLVETVGAVRQHLASVERDYHELDTRFGGWIVVRRRGA